MVKEISAPNIIHSEKGTGFHDFFKEQCKKVERSHNRCHIETRKARYSDEYASNYDTISWESNKQTQLAKHL